MARGPALTVEALAKLGADRLAALVFDEAGRNAPFKKLAAAALASTKGPDAVAALVDRRLAALERARGQIDYEKRKAFAADLDATLATAVGELGKLDPLAAIDRTLRFIRGAAAVLERVDDTNDDVSAVYGRAAEAVPALAARLPEADRAEVAARLGRLLEGDVYGHVGRALRGCIGLLAPPSLPGLDAALKAMQPARSAADWRAKTLRDALLEARQALADKAGDVDAFVTLEGQRHGKAPDTVAVAERLLGAGRLAEALDWARRGARSGREHGRFEDVADGTPFRDSGEHHRVALEIRVLDAMGRRDAAQALRWAVFDDHLEAEVLRDIVGHSPDFGEFDVLDRAFAAAAGHPRRYAALTLFVAWPRLDLAARLVLDHRDAWDGRHWGVLAPAAEALAPDHPVAATVLYRALIDDILERARSKAYGHGARHLAMLGTLAPEADGHAGLPAHALYRAGLQRAHGRKAAFWSLVDKA